jgi:alpha-glucosidase
MMRAPDFLLVALMAFLGNGLWGEPVSLSSPAGKVKIAVEIKENRAAHPGERRLYWSVTYKGMPVLVDSTFELEFRDMPPLGKDLAVKKNGTKTIRETWRRIWGKRAEVMNSAAELELDLEEAGPPHRRITLLFRAYDDGFAFRYVLPEQAAFSEFRLAAEKAEFAFIGIPRVWAADYGGFVSHQESEFQESAINELNPDKPYGVPVLVKSDHDFWAAITEADLLDWAGMYLSRDSARINTLVSVLSPRPDEPGVAVRSRTPRRSPWRVVLLGERAGDLIESDLIDNLSTPCALQDTSWIKPGRAAWDRWWCGDYLPEADFKVGMNTATMKYFVDFAAEMGWEYQLVDWLWYGKPFKEGTTIGDPSTDITKSIPEVDIPGLVRYAKDRGVRILVWLDWEATARKMDEAFPLYEKWGVAGVKVDFMQRDDQEMVNFYERTVRKAAEHHLTVDFHGAYKPTGLSRTYPNLLTREGVMGNEYNKWSARITPDHCLTIPFTRMLAGGMDFTPGGFRQKTKDTFRAVGADAPGPFVMGTRCFQLAMLVVYESALQVLCDSPYCYHSSPAGLGFLRTVPTTWDETRVIAGEVGDFIAVARRHGDAWYIGAMTDWEPRALKIPLDFLGEGRFQAEIWQDAYEAADYPDRLMKDKKAVSTRDTLEARMASGGGWVAVIRPEHR